MRLMASLLALSTLLNVPLASAFQASVVLGPDAVNPIASARMIVDNEESFRSKISLINSAREKIQLMYYIYAEDESSSYLTKQLIEKARAGVKIELLVDLHTNFSRWDLFKMMEREGRGNLQVRFYNRPTPALVRDLTFMSATCQKGLAPAACRAERKAKAESAFAEMLAASAQGRPAQLPTLTSAMLAGIYAKSGGAIKAAIALGTGADLAEVKKIIESMRESGGSEADFEQLKTLLKLIVDAKLRGSAAAKLQLAMALASYGEQIEPIIKLFDLAVPDTMRDGLFAEDDWAHLTDFLHHKFLLVDDKVLQIGGRNIENSYHLDARISAADKYLFRDTDFVLRLTNSRAELPRTFSRLFQSRALVASVHDIEQEMNFNFVARAQQLGGLVLTCAASQAGEVDGCLREGSAALLVEDPRRLDAALAQMQTKSASPVIAKVLSGRLAAGAYSGEVGTAELAGAQVAYLENIPYDLNGPEIPRERLYFQDGREAASRRAKNIHLAVEEGIERTCALATADFKKARDKKLYLANRSNWRRIVLNQGYVIFPGELLQTLGRVTGLRAVQGGSTDPKCPAVEIEILTNSVGTTDLSVINLFASLQVGSLLDANAKAQGYYDGVSDDLVKARMFPPARLRYFELQPPTEAFLRRGGSLESLHSKVFVLGPESVIVGSANADVRSYFMDTNNALELKRVPELVLGYLRWVETQKLRSDDGRAFYLELTQPMAAPAAALVGLLSDDAKVTRERRLQLLRGIYTQELQKIADHFARKWRSKAAEGSAEDKAKVEERIAKMQKHLPTLVNAVANLNLHVFEVSQKVITGESGEVPLEKIIFDFNQKFQVL